MNPLKASTLLAIALLLSSAVHGQDIPPALEIIEAEGVTVQAIPIGPTAKESVKIIIATVVVPDLREGDVVRLDGTYEVTNDLKKSGKPFNVGCACQFRMEPAAVRGLTMAVSANVTPDNHHFTYTRFGFHKEKAAGTQEYHLVVWAHSSKVKATDKLILRVDRVHLAATVHRVGR